MKSGWILGLRIDRQLSRIDAQLVHEVIQVLGAAAGKRPLFWAVRALARLQQPENVTGWSLESAITVCGSSGWPGDGQPGVMVWASRAAGI